MCKAFCASGKYLIMGTMCFLGCTGYLPCFSSKVLASAVCYSNKDLRSSAAALEIVIVITLGWLSLHEDLWKMDGFK